MARGKRVVRAMCQECNEYTFQELIRQYTNASDVRCRTCDTTNRVRIDDGTLVPEGQKAQALTKEVEQRRCQLCHAICEHTQLDIGMVLGTANTVVTLQCKNCNGVYNVNISQHYITPSTSFFG